MSMPCDWKTLDQETNGLGILQGKPMAGKPD